MPTIGILSAGIFGVFAASLVLPLLAAVIEGNWRAAEAIFLTGIGYGFFSSVSILALTPRQRTLNRAGIFSAAIAIWVSLVLAATPIFMLVERQSLLAALFEASSAVTTLGVTLRPVQDISSAMALYRGTTGWLGGLLTLTLAVYILGPYRVGGTPNAHLRRVQHARTESDPRIMMTLRSIFLPYLTLTLAASALLVIVRVPADEAIVVAMSMLATNGFIPHQTSTSVLGNSSAEIIMIVFMILGATSIIWHKLLVGRIGGASEERTEGRLYLTALFVLVAMGLFASVLAPSTGRIGFQAALNYVFDLVSVATTTGVTHDNRVGISVPFEIILLIVFVGGCSFSTAGGIKAFRVVSMLKRVGNELERLVYPSAYLKDDVQYDEGSRSIAKATWSAFFLAVLTLTVAIVLFSAQGHPLPSAMALAAGSFSQVGNLVADAVPGLAQGTADQGTLATVALLSVVARIDILVVLAAIAGKRW